MIFTRKLILNLQLYLVFLYAFTAILQVIGIYVLYVTKRLRGSQRIILINVSICHLWFSVCSIFKLSIGIIKNSIELNKNVDKFTRCVSLMLFATAEISDTFIYIILQKNVRKKINLLLKTTFGKINCFERRQKFQRARTTIIFRDKI